VILLRKNELTTIKRACQHLGIAEANLSWQVTLTPTVKPKEPPSQSPMLGTRSSQKLIEVRPIKLCIYTALYHLVLLVKMPIYDGTKVISKLMKLDMELTGSLNKLYDI
jgi:hypothetical protein